MRAESLNYKTNSAEQKCIGKIARDFQMLASDCKAGKGLRILTGSGGLVSRLITPLSHIVSGVMLIANQPVQGNRQQRWSIWDLAPGKGGNVKKVSLAI